MNHRRLLPIELDGRTELCKLETEICLPPHSNRRWIIGESTYAVGAADSGIFVDVIGESHGGDGGNNELCLNKKMNIH